MLSFYHSGFKWTSVSSQCSSFLYNNNLILCEKKNICIFCCCCCWCCTSLLHDSAFFSCMTHTCEKKVNYVRRILILFRLFDPNGFLTHSDMKITTTTTTDEWNKSNRLISFTNIFYGIQLKKTNYTLSMFSIQNVRLNHEKYQMK